jgi:hypothetical protein
MISNTLSENKVVAALLTVALAKSQQPTSSEEVLSNYRKFLSELSPTQPPTPYEPDTPGRKMREEA